MNHSIGQRIRKLRENKDLSQDNIAFELGITKGAYSKIETGRTDPSASRLIELAKVLEVDVTEFFKDPKTPIGVAEGGKDYGFATKDDLEDVRHTIWKISLDIELLKSNLASLMGSPASRKSRK